MTWWWRRPDPLIDDLIRNKGVRQLPPGGIDEEARARAAARREQAEKLQRHVNQVRTTDADYRRLLTRVR